MSPEREKAVQTLTFYFRQVFEAGGLKWDADNQAEVESAVDNIIAAAHPDNRRT